MAAAQKPPVETITSSGVEVRVPIPPPNKLGIGTVVVITRKRLDIGRSAFGERPYTAAQEPIILIIGASYNTGDLVGYVVSHGAVIHRDMECCTPLTDQTLQAQGVIKKAMEVYDGISYKVCPPGTQVTITQQ